MVVHGDASARCTDVRDQFSAVVPRHYQLLAHLSLARRVMLRSLTGAGVREICGMGDIAAHAAGFRVVELNRPGHQMSLDYLLSGESVAVALRGFVEIIDAISRCQSARLSASATHNLQLLRRLASEHCHTVRQPGPQRRVFVMVNKRDRQGWPPPVIYGLAVFIILEPGSVFLESVMAHPLTQLDDGALADALEACETLSDEAKQMVPTGRNYRLKGIGTTLVTDALLTLVARDGVRMVSGEAINPRSVAMKERLLDR
jgi:hypothetical protein